MQTRAPITGLSIAGSGLTIYGRIVGALAVPITPASISSITYAVTDLTTGLSISTGTLTPATVVLASLVQNDPLWTIDSASAPGPDDQWGYNFLATLPSTAYVPVTTLPINAPAGPNWSQPVPDAHKVRIDVAFTASGGAVFRVPWETNVVPVYG